MNTDLNKEYGIILNSLKEKIRQARLKASIEVNKALLGVYWEIGNTISKQEVSEGWGAKTVDKLALDLRNEFQDMKGLSSRNLRYMRDFALAYPHFTILQESNGGLKGVDSELFVILQQSVAKLPWGHNCVLLDKIKHPEERLFYAQKALANGWTRNILINQIESGLYNRHGALTNNFEQTIPAYQSELAVQLFKDPYQLDFIMLREEAKEKELEDALMSHITKLLLELGDGFAFMGRQRKFEAGGKEFFIDLLFYNTKLRRHIIIELKIGEFEPEFVSKMNLYLGLADDNLKGQFDNPAIGLILCKTKNKIVAEYALRDTSKPIGIAEYKISEMLPDDIKGELPSIEEIEQRMDEELKEKENPIEARLKAVKDKLKEIKVSEIETPATNKLLQNLFMSGLKPLYQQIIQKFCSEFNDIFVSQSAQWTCGNQVVNNLEEVEAYWTKEDLTNMWDMNFSYYLTGFKKAGTEHFDVWLDLKFIKEKYWYGFSLMHHKNQEPILKKLYHELITTQDIQMIEDLLVSKVLDRIEWIIERVNNRDLIK